MKHTPEIYKFNEYVHKGCGGAVVIGPHVDAPVCAACNANLNNDSQIERHPNA